MSRRGAGVLAATALIAGGSLAAPVAAGAEGCRSTSCQIQREVDAVVRAGVPGVVFLVRDGVRVRVYTAGRAEASRPRPISRTDRFRIASISKTFLAVAILKQVAANRIGLDERVSRWLPRMFAGSQITVRQLLNHTSGLFDYADDESWWSQVKANPTRVWNPEDLFAISAAHGPYFAPGEGWHYSNTNYLALAMLLEAVTGRAHGEVIREAILRPLHLHDTAFPAGTDIPGRHAHGYTDDGSGLRDTTAMSPSLAWGSGEIVSTVTDVQRFFEALLEGRLLPGDLLAQMETTVPTGDGSEYGLGLARVPQSCGVVTYGHTGGILGFSSDAEQTVDGRRELVVFANTDSIPPGAYPHFQLAGDLAYCGRRPTG
jgi:D-alanyl-D-alanine carboxypeptidase